MSTTEFHIARDIIELIKRARSDTDAALELSRRGLRKDIDFFDSGELIKLCRSSPEITAEPFGIADLTHHYYYQQDSDCLYQLLREDEADALGKGGFGEVVQAISEKESDQLIAIKIMGAEQREMQARESSMLTRVGEAKGGGLVGKEAVLIMTMHPGKNLAFAGATPNQILEEVLLAQYSMMPDILNIVRNFFSAYCEKTLAKPLTDITSDELLELVRDPGRVQTNFDDPTLGLVASPYADALREDISVIAEQATNVLSSRIEVTDKTQKLQIAFQVALKLSALHEKGIGHRDIKGENILAELSPGSEQVNLVDYGLALKEEEFTLETASGAGTLQYIAPELSDIRAYALQQIAFEEVPSDMTEEFSYAADVYSLCRFLVRDLGLDPKNDVFGMIQKGLCIRAEDRPSLGQLICALQASLDPELMEVINVSNSQTNLLLSTKILIDHYQRLSEPTKHADASTIYKRKFIESKIIENINIAKEGMRSFFVWKTTTFDPEQPLSDLFEHAQGKNSGFSGSSTRSYLNKLGLMQGQEISELGRCFIADPTSDAELEVEHPSIKR